MLNFPKVKFVRMTGRVLHIVAYFNLKKSLKMHIKYLEKSIKIIGVLYLKLYKGFFL